MNDLLPISTLNKLVYCPRRFWYMYVLGEIEINAPMLEGSLQHQTRVDRPGQETDEDGNTIHRRTWVWNERLNIAGFADLVESDGQSFAPVEYKHGQKGEWDNDEIQLCAQALCLEEMTGQPVERGEIFYWRSRQRVTVHFDEALRQQTEAAVHYARVLLAANQIPEPLPSSERRKCKHCSLQPICLPEEVRMMN